MLCAEVLCGLSLKVYTFSKNLWPQCMVAKTTGIEVDSCRLYIFKFEDDYFISPISRKSISVVHSLARA